MAKTDAAAAAPGGGVRLRTVAAVALCAAGAAYLYARLSDTPPLPQLGDPWWSRAPRPATEDTAVRPFTITAPAGMMADLRARLERAESRLTAPLEGAAFTYGFDNLQLKKVLHHWRTGYDWPRRLHRMNQFPHFKTNIQGLDIHFIHVKPKVPAGQYQVVPLLLLHGWPGSFLEFYGALPLLTQPRPGYQLVFEVVCPSLPGYGFSTGAEKPGLGSTEVADLMRRLMLRLGFQKFFVQGGDWGSLIAMNMGTLFPDNIEGVHLNMPVAHTLHSQLLMLVGTIFPSAIGSQFFQRAIYPLGETFSRLVRETGYLHLQATKPDTVGVALNDSPAGLAAYILEKFSSWTNMANLEKADGGLTERFALDDLLDNVMLYWMTESITTSMRLYAESFSQRTRTMQMEKIPCRVPTGALYAPHELFPSSPRQLSRKFPDLVDWRLLEEGGHFLAMEAPQLLVEHVFVTFTEIRRRRAEEEKQRQPPKKESEKPQKKTHKTKGKKA